MIEISRSKELDRHMLQIVEELWKTFNINILKTSMQEADQAMEKHNIKYQQVFQKICINQKIIPLPMNINLKAMVTLI